MANIELLLPLALILIGARLVGRLSQRLGLPAVLGELVAGLVLGPSLLGLVPESEALNAVAGIGVLLLMFIAGLETDLPRKRLQRRPQPQQRPHRRRPRPVSHRPCLTRRELQLPGHLSKRQHHRRCPRKPRFHPARRLYRLRTKNASSRNICPLSSMAPAMARWVRMDRPGPL